MLADAPYRQYVLFIKLGMFSISEKFSSFQQFDLGQSAPRHESDFHKAVDYSRALSITRG